MGATHLNQNTAKPLIDELKTIIKPQDEVATYFKFYHDVPLYLERRITIVANWHTTDIANKDNWLREIWYGMPFQKTDDWLINESTFWKRWEDNKRLFVFVNDNFFDQFKKQAKSIFHEGLAVLHRRHGLTPLPDIDNLLSWKPGSPGILDPDRDPLEEWVSACLA